MRFLYLLFLLAFVGAVVAFAVQNQQDVPLSFFRWEVAWPVAAVVVGSYLLGMFSGWSVVGLLRRSYQRASEVFDGKRPADAPR